MKKERVKKFLTNFGWGELHYNLSGKDELQDKINTLVIFRLRENFNQSDKITDQLKETQSKIISSKINLNYFGKAMILYEIQDLREAKI